MKQSFEFKIYYPTLNSTIQLIGEFNSWGQDVNSRYFFSNEIYPYYTLTTPIPHLTPYLFKIDGLITRDPSSIYFDEDLNSIYWDFKDSSSYKHRYKLNVHKNRSLKILQTDLPGLIFHYRGKNGKLGNEVKFNNYYKFITQSGVIDKIKELGFNAIQFLPVTKSVDGDNWKFRYLCPFPKAIEDKWGNINDFSEMIDAFHEQKIIFIQDSILSHTPFKNYRVNGVPSRDCSLPFTYLGDETTWGTKRYQYEDIGVQNYLIENVLYFSKTFNVDGFRIDNVDGIIRFGENGDGKERPGGRDFLRNLTSSLYKSNDQTIISLESHFYEADNAKMLIAPIESNPRALEATAYTSSRETFFFQTDYMPKSSSEIKSSRIKEIIEEKEWGESNATIADFHNHDAASGLMEMRATGSYAYDAIILNNSQLHIHAVGKIKVMEAIISLCLEGRSLDLLQTFMLQTGSFEHDSTIHWFLEMVEANKAMIDYKKKINDIMDYEDFWPDHVSQRKILLCDDASKIIVFQKGKFIIFVNMSGDLISNYSVPISINGEFELLLNSDEFKYSGFGRTIYPNIIETKPGPKLKFDWIAPYQILVLKFIKK